MKVIYKSAEIREEIGKLFSSSKGRRVAVAAFVGDGAEDYVRRPRGLHIYCWPKAGGTNPNALRKLIRLGAEVHFSDALHMKVYWTEDRGAIITSANLSTNALGSGDLKEIGVRLKSSEVDIDRIIKSIRPRRVEPAELRELERQHNLYAARNPRRAAGRPRPDTFADWYDSYSRSGWKLYLWEGYGHRSRAAHEVSRKEYGNASFQCSIAARGGGDYTAGNWILCLRRRGDAAAALEWMYVNFSVRVPRSDKRAYDRSYPYELVQVWPLRRYEPPPFSLDAGFRSAFRKAAGEYGLDKLGALKSPRPPAKLLGMIYERLKA
jgi:hypothetical protein